MTDNDLGRIWAKHFPKSTNGHVSEQICRMVCLIVEKKLLIEFAVIHEEALAKVLNQCKIPRSEFVACRNLTKPVYGLR